jgi:hypothetical protein
MNQYHCACRKTSSPSCDQTVFVDQTQTTDASLSSDTVVLKIDWFGQRLQRCRPVQEPVRPVLWWFS